MEEFQRDPDIIIPLPAPNIENSHNFLKLTFDYDGIVVKPKILYPIDRPVQTATGSLQKGAAEELVACA